MRRYGKKIKDRGVRRTDKRIIMERNKDKYKRGKKVDGADPHARVKLINEKDCDLDRIRCVQCQALSFKVIGCIWRFSEGIVDS